MRRKIDLLILIFVLILGTVGILNAKSIGDYWHEKRYSPDETITSLADDSGMSSIGRKYFYRFSPKIISKNELDQLCNTDQLGCVEGNSMYILESNNKEENNRNTVTAAHEMLHIAYSRMSNSEKSDLEKLIDVELEKSQSSKIVKELKNYPSEDYYNEAHSFIGSEVKDISPELENHYSKYFINRSKTTNAYFNSPERKIN